MKNLIKNTVDAFAFVLVLPAILIFWISARLLGENASVMSFSQMFSLLPGKTGGYLRKRFYRHILAYCDRDCAIGFGTLFSQYDTEIHKGVYIGPQCNIGKSRIEKNCLLGSGVHILSGKNQHAFDDLDVPIQQQGGQYQKVIIGEDSWLGNGSIVMANVGKKCIVAAGSVVTKDVADFSIVAGNPAQFVRDRRTKS